MDLCTLSLLFQSTFPRGERLIPLVTHVKSQVISIHVPSWGTTIFCILFWIKVSISIHVPSWGTTTFKCRLHIFNGNFNPRSLVGNDTGEALAVRCVVISIHVPSWGTTGFQFLFQKPEAISIHVPSWGTT